MKKVVLASVISVVMLMTINAIYADCGAGSCSYVVNIVSEPDPYCACYGHSCVGMGPVGLEYICEWSDECNDGYSCFFVGSDPESWVLQYGEVVCYSTHEEEPWCNTDADCELHSFVNCNFLEESICECM